MGIKNVKAGDLLFREGDISDSLYVVKKGRLTVCKTKGASEVELAEVAPGQLIGEMAFFDRKPRSASIRAKTDAEVVELPFKNLQPQFDAMPEWVKAMIKAINDNLREANKKIKTLDVATPGGKAGAVNPHQANKLTALLMFVANKFGTPVPEGIDIKPGILRKFTIQVFGEATNKMQTVMTVLQEHGVLKQEDIGDGKQKVTLFKKDILENFVEWLTENLFADDDKKQTIAENELKWVRALIHFGKRGKPDDKGIVAVNAIEMQNESMKDLGYVVSLTDTNSLCTKGVIIEKFAQNELTFMKINLAELEKVYPLWLIYYAIEKA